MSKLSEYRESLRVKEEEEAFEYKKEAAKRMKAVNEKLKREGVKIKSSNSKRYEDPGYDIPEENDDER